MARRLLGMTLALGLGQAIPGCTSESCSSLVADAQGLRDEFERCSGTDTCQVVDLYALAGDPSCLGPFQCSTAFRVGANTDDFSSRAKELARRYKGSCNTCTEAGCVSPPKSAHCNPQTSRCEIDPTGAGGSGGAGGAPSAGSGGAGG